jgi:hypothetical protein
MFSDMKPPAPLPPTLLSVAERFALIVGGLRAAVAGRIGYYAVTGEMILYICNRLNRLNQRFQALTALILAGKLPAERVYRTRAVAPAPVPPPPNPEATAGREFFPIWRLVPTHRFAWLCMVAPNWAGSNYAAVWGAAMRDLLADPRMAALLAATPRMGKLLRPLCWGLGIEASMLQPRVAPPDAAEAATAAVDAEADEIVSRDAAVMTPVAARDKAPAATRPDGFCLLRFFAPA